MLVTICRTAAGPAKEQMIRDTYPILTASIDWDEPGDPAVDQLLGPLTAAMYQVYSLVTDDDHPAPVPSIEDYILALDRFEERFPGWVISCLATALPIWRSALADAGYSPGELTEFTAALKHLLRQVDGVLEDAD